MLLKTKHTLAAVALFLCAGLVNVGCTDDEAPTEEPVKTDTAAAEPPPAPPAETAPMAFTPETVYFAFDDYTLNSEAQNKLQGLADHLKKSQGTLVQVEGHCDERGSIEYNLALGERRAQSVKNYLTQLGVEAGRLSTISYGEEKPAAEGHDEGAWAKNRRAEFTVSSNQ
jgi:peptidoglycan-associated lipoprotein